MEILSRQPVDSCYALQDGQHFFLTTSTSRIVSLCGSLGGLQPQFTASASHDQRLFFLSNRSNALIVSHDYDLRYTLGK